MKDESAHREIETEFLKIHGNCMEFRNTIIQLSNVSLISSEEIASPKFPTWTILAIIAGLAMFAFSSTMMTVLGIAVIAYAGIIIYQWHSRTEETKEIKKLLIMTNSGNRFTIVFNNRAFLEHVIQVLTEVIANPDHTSDVTINIKDNTFSDSASAIQSFEEIKQYRKG